MKPLVLPCLLLVALLLFMSCTPADRFVAGEALDAAGLESVSAALTETEEVTEEATEEMTFPYTYPDAETYPVGTVHWTADGEVYHTDLGCRHLAGAEKIYHSAPYAAGLAGKERACSTCVPAKDAD